MLSFYHHYVHGMPSMTCWEILCHGRFIKDFLIFLQRLPHPPHLVVNLVPGDGFGVLLGMGHAEVSFHCVLIVGDELLHEGPHGVNG